MSSTSHYRGSITKTLVPPAVVSSRLSAVRGRVGLRIWMACGCVVSVGEGVISSGRVRIGSGLVRIPFAIIIFARGVGRIWARLGIRLGGGRWWNFMRWKAGCRYGGCEGDSFVSHVYRLFTMSVCIIRFISQQCQSPSQTIYISARLINRRFH